jgi:hypothetical protein
MSSHAKCHSLVVVAHNLELAQMLRPWGNFSPFEVELIFDSTPQKDPPLDPALLDMFHSPAASPQPASSVVHEASPPPAVRASAKDNGHTSSIPKPAKSPAAAPAKNPAKNSFEHNKGSVPKANGSRGGKPRNKRPNGQYAASQAVHA